MKTVAIVAARLSSSRLPGKVLRPINGTPLLERMYKRLCQCKTLDEIIIGTSDNPQDDVLIDFCRKKAMAVERGSENDVLGRYQDIARSNQADVVVRLTGDCPLIDPSVTDEVVRRHRANKNTDFASNVFNRTYPRGLDTEVFSFHCLDRVARETKETIYREHVTNYIYDHPEQFAIESIENPIDYSKYRICVDTEEDFRLVEELYKVLDLKAEPFTWLDVVALLQNRPELVAINQNVQQSKIFLNRAKQ